MTKFVSLEEAAETLGVSKDKVTELREAGQMHGYRDGTSWKFKTEEVQRVAEELAAGGGNDDEFDFALDDDDASQDDILFSEVELGESIGKGPSTIIGKSSSPADPSQSDIELAAGSVIDAAPNLSLDGSGVELTVGSDAKLASISDVLTFGEPTEGDTKGSGLSLELENIDLENLDSMEFDLNPGSGRGTAAASPSSKLGSSDLALDGSGLSLAPPSSGTGKNVLGGSSVDLADDDDLVVLGDGSGNDITLGNSESGISLVDPQDSGLSLDQEPLALGGSEVESLELGEDEEISLGDGGDLAPISHLKADDDFLLTPLDEGAGEDADDSGSQVIALDSESSDALLDSGEPVMAAAFADELGGVGTAALRGTGAAPLVAASSGGVETPYSVWNVVSLGLCLLLLSLTGIMMYDLVRNMWSWNEAYAANSTIMDGLMKAIPIFK